MRFVGVLLGLALCFYPFCVYFGLQQFGPRALAFVLFTLFLVRYLTFKDKTGFLQVNLLPAASVAGAAFCALAAVTDRADFLKFYPALSNVFLFVLFAVSLRRPPSLIERAARLRHPDLSPRGVKHTRQATALWSLFFVFNGCVALVTALYADLKLWTLYNGFLSYLLMGVLFAVEFVVRKARMARDADEAASL